MTGGSGFLGRHVLNSVETDTWQLVAPSSASLDLRHPDSVADVIHDWRPTAIVHTAYRQDDAASIVDASEHVAVAAARSRSRLIHVSTDVVFGGRAAAYVEQDLPTPISAYGRAKAEAEQRVAAACPHALIVRTSLLIGRSELSAHERLVRDAVSGTADVTFFTDEIRCPLLVDDLAVAIVQLAGRPDVTGVLHLAGPTPISRAELALVIARRHGWDTKRIRTGPAGRDTTRGSGRPGTVVLDTSLARSMGFGVRGPRDW